MASKATQKKTNPLQRSMAHRRVDFAAFLIQELAFVPPQPKSKDEVGFSKVVRKHSHKKPNLTNTKEVDKVNFPALSPSKKTKTTKTQKKSNRFELE